MKPNLTKYTVGIVVGALLLLASPVVARLYYVSGFQRGTEALGWNSGVSDPKGLSSGIDTMLSACAGGLVGAVIGLIVLIVSIVLRSRALRRNIEE